MKKLLQGAIAADLFAPLRLGPYTLPNRMVMAPLTRSRADDKDVPGDLAATYYAQRSGAGLIISEATHVSAQGKGYTGTPGIYNEEQIRQWRRITDAVHAAGGRIFAQLWHVGRISHRLLQPDNATPVAPSAVQPDGRVYIDNGFVALERPRALETHEIPGIIAQFRDAARNALRAGFQGIEIHAANGYLLDQFLRDKTNQRTDAYGGSIENRARLLLEITQAVIDIWGRDRVGVRISPLATFNDISDSDPEPLFTYVAQQLGALRVAYLHVVEGAWGSTREVAGGFDPRRLRLAFNGVYIANNCYGYQDGMSAIESGHADMVSYGRHFLSNPDLVERFRTGAPLNPPDPNTFYGGDAKGYTDYPTMAQRAA
ncbi:alkene reductase [Cupriavidus sp. 2SB]|uniref:alkene reductase n=1 Tax=Cupriavidus sp. 2SB TaxID=2502199 RepID=UPI0010F4BC1A|nr:alkene reductase [Cupriavidus sp. 2SB]